MEGAYLHFVADLSHLMVTHGSFTTSICTVGVFGTRYVRDGDPLPSSIEIAQGEVIRVSVPHIYSEFTIGTTLAINLRQAASTQHDFVTIEEYGNSNDVIIEPGDQSVGEYDLTLESFNTLSISKSALKIDTIKIIIRPPTPPTFMQKLSVKSLIVGQP